jgi:hypothetical protein
MSASWWHQVQKTVQHVSDQAAVTAQQTKESAQRLSRRVQLKVERDVMLQRQVTQCKHRVGPAVYDVIYETLNAPAAVAADATMPEQAVATPGTSCSQRRLQFLNTTGTLIATVLRPAYLDAEMSITELQSDLAELTAKEEVLKQQNEMHDQLTATSTTTSSSVVLQYDADLTAQRYLTLASRHAIMAKLHAEQTLIRHQISKHQANFGLAIYDGMARLFHGADIVAAIPSPPLAEPAVENASSVDGSVLDDQASTNGVVGLEEVDPDETDTTSNDVPAAEDDSNHNASPSPGTPATPPPPTTLKEMKMRIMELFYEAYEQISVIQAQQQEKEKEIAALTKPAPPPLAPKKSLGFRSRRSATSDEPSSAPPKSPAMAMTSIRPTFSISDEDDDDLEADFSRYNPFRGASRHDVDLT